MTWILISLLWLFNVIMLDRVDALLGMIPHKDFDEIMELLHPDNVSDFGLKIADQKIAEFEA